MHTKTELIDHWKRQDYPGQILLFLVFLSILFSASIHSKYQAGA